MLKISEINNVNNTLIRKNISFKAGVQTNYGIDVPSPKDNMVEGGLFTGFVGTVFPFFNTIQSRAKSIEKGLEETKLNILV